jgi:hypothetical protein
MSPQNNKRRGMVRPKTSRSNKTFGSAVPNQLYSASFPREMKVTLRYSEFFQSTSTVGLLHDQVMNLNSIYDPNRTGVGHQAQGYDQWALFYNRYRVDGAMLTVRFTNAPTSGAIFSILGNNDGSAMNDPSVITESPLSLTKAMAANGPAVTLQKYFDLANLNGVSRSVYNADDRYAAPFGSSPTEILVGHVGAWNASSYTYDYQVEVKYYVTLFDPLQLPLS